MNKRLGIINSICYGAKNAGTKSFIKTTAEDLGLDIVFTEYQGHAEKITRDSSGYDVLIAFGGDGTIHEIVNNMNMETQALAVVPIGTGNSLTRDLGINTLINAFDVIKKDGRDKIDTVYCRFDDGKKKITRYMVTTSGIGFAANAASFGGRYLKKTGPFCYALAACVKSFNQSVIRADIRVDNNAPENIKFTNFFLNNTRHSGNLCIFPQAGLKDSALDALFTRTNVLTQYLWNTSVITGTYFYYPGKRTLKELYINLSEPSEVMLDGEMFRAIKEIKYSVAPQKLTIIN